MSVVFTEITNCNGTINKSIDLVEGKIVKTTSGTVVKGTAKTMSVPLTELCSYLEGLNTQAEKAIVLGIWKDGTEFDEYDITTAGNENESDGLISRTKKYLEYANSDSTSLLLLDIDSGSDHGNWTEAEIADFILILETVLAESLISEHASARKHICRFTKKSSSAGVMFDGSPVSQGTHIYLPVKNASAKLLELIYKFAWMNGFNSHLISGSGRVLSRSIIDEAVKGPERLVFESDVSTETLVKIERTCSYSPGGIIDNERACQLLEEYTIEYERKWNEYKERVIASPEAIKAVSTYIKKQTEKLVSEKGLNVKAAKNVVTSRQGGIILSSDFLIDDNDKEISVYDVLTNRDAYNNMTGLKDPLEPEYGKGKAKLFCSDTRVALHSFAHGSQTYVLKFDFAGMEAWMKDLDVVELEECFADFLSQASLSGVQEAKILKEIAKRLDVATVAVKDDIRESSRQAQIEEDTESLGRVLLGVEATQAEISDGLLGYFDKGHKIFGGNLYSFDKTIWGKQTGSSLIKRVAEDYRHCSRCKMTGHYESIVKYSLKTSDNVVDTWKSEYGFPCAGGFHKVGPEGITVEKYAKEHGARYKMGFNPDPSVKTPMWDKILHNIVNVRCFQQMVGLTLCGMLTSKLQMAGVMKGEGGLGKGTVSKVMTAMLPKDRVMAVKLHEMNDATIAADLADCVANFIPEIASGVKIATEGFKMITGGDRMRGRRLYSDSFYFHSTAAQVLSCNDWPVLDSCGSEIERRLGHFIIDFKKNYKEVIPGMDVTIIEHELPGILAWAMIGVEDWIQNGIDDEHSLELFKGWVNSFDSVELFLMDKCDFGGRLKVLRSGLYSAYKDYCIEAKYFAKRKGQFFEQMLKIKTVKLTEDAGVWTYHGMELK